jgi:hypothetical protein
MSIDIQLRVVGRALRAIYTNRGTHAVALTFWWNRRMRVARADGTEIAAGKGPVLPCGVGEDWQVLQPGESYERDEPLQCTQPAGTAKDVGWSFDLPRGTYRVTLVYESPPPHGFTQSEPHPDQYRGRIESNDVLLVVA